MRTLLVAALLLLLTACGDEPDAGSDQDAARFPSVSDWVTPRQRAASSRPPSTKAGALVLADGRVLIADNRDL